MKELFLFGISFCIFVVCNGQRVAPGVPPQHYQNAPMNQVPQQQQYQADQHHQQQQQVYQQQQHVQMPQHQVPMQQQQVPVHQQQHVPMQQQPPQIHQPHVQHQPHGGHGSHGQQGVLNSNMEHEKQHIAEHMDVPIDTSKMSEQELQFHYFKMHDADNNNRLDGCELIKSLIHWHEQGSKEHPQPGAQQVEEKIFTDDELIALIDPILNMDDGNRDGFIDYPEFVKAQQKAQNQPQPTTP